MSNDCVNDVVVDFHLVPVIAIVLFGKNSKNNAVCVVILSRTACNSRVSRDIHAVLIIQSYCSNHWRWVSPVLVG